LLAAKRIRDRIALCGDEGRSSALPEWMVRRFRGGDDPEFFGALADARIAAEADHRPVAARGRKIRLRRRLFRRGRGDEPTRVDGRLVRSLVEGSTASENRQRGGGLLPDGRR